LQKHLYLLLLNVVHLFSTAYSNKTKLEFKLGKNKDAANGSSSNPIESKDGMVVFDDAVNVQIVETSRDTSEMNDSNAFPAQQHFAGKTTK